MEKADFLPPVPTSPSTGTLDLDVADVLTLFTSHNLRYINERVMDRSNKWSFNPFIFFNGNDSEIHHFALFFRCLNV